MKDIKSIISLLPQTYSEIEIIEDSLHENECSILTSKIESIYDSIQRNLGELPESLNNFDQINNDNIHNWKSILLEYIF